MSDIFAPSDIFKLKPSQNIFSPTYKPPKVKLSPEIEIKRLEEQAKRQHIPVPKHKKIRVWDLLEWTRYPITNMLYTTFKELKEGDLSFEDIDKILKAGMYGVLLKEKHNTEDILKMMFPNLKTWQYKVFGTIGDIVTDPLTYVSFGTAGVGKEGARAVSTARKAAAEVTERLSKKATSIASNVRGGVGSAAYRNFEKKLIEKFGGRNVQEAIKLAARQKYAEIAKPGINIGLPFTKFKKQIIPGYRSDIAANILKKFGAGEKVTKAIKESPVRLQSAPVIGGALKAFDPTMKYGKLEEAHWVDVQKRAEKGLRAQRMGEILDGLNLNVTGIAKEPPTPELKKFIDEGRDLLKKYKLNWTGKYAKRDALLFNFIHKYEKGEKIPDALKPLADRIKEFTDTVWTELHSRGLLKKKQYIERYFPRYFVNKSTGEIASVTAKPLHQIERRFLKHRVFRTIDEAIKHGFEPVRPFDNLKIYAGAVNKSLYSYDLIKRLVRKFGAKLKPSKSGKLPSKETLMRRFGEKYTRLHHPMFKDWVVPSSIGDALNRIDLVLTEEKELRNLIKTANAINNIWKKSATIIWPGFHLRNFYSNIWTLLFKDGMGAYTVRNYRKAMKIFKNPYSDEVIKIFNPHTGKWVKKPIRLIYEQFRRYGIHTGGWYATELGETLAKPTVAEKIAEKLGTVPEGIVRTYRGFEKKATHFGSMVENTARMASALNDIEKGFSLSEAARRVNAAFINYQDITKVEEKIRKIIPFWSWLRHNFTNQLNYIVTRPGEYMMFTIHPLKAINWADEETEKYKPDWAKEQMLVQPFGLNIGGVPLMLNPNLPFQDVGKLVINQPLRSVGRALISGVTPLIKTPIETSLNKSYFTGRPIQYDERQTEKAPPLIEPIILAMPEKVRRRLGIVKTERGWEIPAKWAYTLINVIPQMKVGKEIETLAHPLEAEYRQRRAPFNIASRTTGIKFYPLDVKGYYKGKALAERLRELKGLINKYGG